MNRGKESNLALLPRPALHRLEELRSTFRASAFETQMNSGLTKSHSSASAFDVTRGSFTFSAACLWQDKVSAQRKRNDVFIPQRDGRAVSATIDASTDGWVVLSRRYNNGLHDGL